MQKTLTKEKLAEHLDGMEYRSPISKGLLELAEKNNLLIVQGQGDATIKFSGAWADRDYVKGGGVTLISREGVSESDCGGGECPYYKSWVRQAIDSGEVIEIKSFWRGRCQEEEMDPWTYIMRGKPTWSYGYENLAGKFVFFNVFDTDGDEREYYCMGLVIDLDEVWPIDTKDQT